MVGKNCQSPALTKTAVHIFNDICMTRYSALKEKYFILLLVTGSSIAESVHHFLLFNSANQFFGCLLSKKVFHSMLGTLKVIFVIF